MGLYMARCFQSCSKSQLNIVRCITFHFILEKVYYSNAGNLLNLVYIVLVVDKQG